MEKNLLALISRALSFGTVPALSHNLGESESAVHNDFGALIPVLPGGLMTKARTPAGASTVLSSVTSPEVETGLLDNLGSLLESGPSSNPTGVGRSLLSSLFGAGKMLKRAGWKSVRGSLESAGGDGSWYGEPFALTRRQVARLLSATLAATALFTASPYVRGCESSPIAREATSSEIAAFVRGQRKAVLTFVGYSGAGYENPPAMLDNARRVLAAHDPRHTIVNIGATEQGIGAVYRLAKAKGFGTMGIVSVLARDERVPLSPCVDFVFYVHDASWGGRLPHSADLSPTSAAIVAATHTLVAIGGGDIARDELSAARSGGKSVLFKPADMNRRLAREKARRQGTPEPADFRGSADKEFGSPANPERRPAKPSSQKTD